MKKKYLFLLIFLILVSLSSTRAQTIKGLYVDGFSSILSNTIKEDSLLNYAQYNGFNYLALYDLWPIHVTYNLTNSSSCAVLSNFIQRAKQNFGISQVGAVGENFFFFNNVIKIYNQQHTNPLQKFDVYNVEFEFWNTASVSTGNYYCTTYLQSAGCSCDTAGAFTFYKKLIHQVDSVATLGGAISETYVGWFNQGQAITIANNVDRILLHDYISNYSSFYSYIKPRLQYIAARNILTDVIPIFSAEPSFMGPWLNTHTVFTPYNDIQTSLTNETGSWKQYINLKGYQWFAYSFMPYNIATSTEIDLNKNQFDVYPNPASNYLIIKGKKQELINVKLVNSLGQEFVVDQLVNEEGFSIDISTLPAGIYFCSLISGNERAMRKIIVSK